MTRFVKPISALLLVACPAMIAAQDSAAPAPAAPAATDAQAMLNTPSVSDWNVYGPGQTHKLHKDKEVQGGGAMQVVIAAKQPNVYDIGASVPVSGSIAKGDHLLVAFWAKLSDGGIDGKVEIPVVSQTASPPYDPIVAGRVTLTGTWTLVSIKGIAAADHAAGSTNVAIQLGGAAAKIDLGPVFVMRLGK